MAVALATLPLKRLVTEAADVFCGTCTGTAATLGADFVGAAFDAGILATGALVAAFAGGLTGVFTAAGFAGAAFTATLLGGAFLAETGVDATFFAGALFTGTFFAAAF